LALSKGAEDFGELGPGAETAFESAMVEFSEVAVGTASGQFAILPNGRCPVLEEFAVFEAFVQGVRLESGSFNGVIPGWEELHELMLGDSGERDEFGSRRSAARAAGDGGQGTENELLV
jgi:hypothetical protein